MLITSNQNVQDVTILATGTIEAIFELAVANDNGITDDLIPGMDYLVPAGLLQNLNNLQYLQQNGIMIGTLGLLPLSSGGIGTWAIGVNFIVS